MKEMMLLYLLNCFQGDLPIGEICEYKIKQDGRTAINRMTSLEKKALETSYDDMYREIRIGAEVHRTVSHKMHLMFDIFQSLNSFSHSPLYICSAVQIRDGIFYFLSFVLMPCYRPIE